MKVIDLLNKIANGEEDDLLTEFEFDKRIWNFKALNDNKFCLDGWLLNQNITITKHKEILEEKKIPEKLGYFDLTKNKNEKDENGNDLELHYTGVADTFDDVYEKINDILDYLDYLKSKGE